MVKYARIVIEIESGDKDSEDDILDKLENELESFVQSHWNIDDVEISDASYKDLGVAFATYLNDELRNLIEDGWSDFLHWLDYRKKLHFEALNKIDKEFLK